MAPHSSEPFVAGKTQLAEIESVRFNVVLVKGRANNLGRKCWRCHYAWECRRRRPLMSLHFLIYELNSTRHNLLNAFRGILKVFEASHAVDMFWIKTFTVRLFDAKKVPLVLLIFHVGPLPKSLDKWFARVCFYFLAFSSSPWRLKGARASHVCSWKYLQVELAFPNPGKNEFYKRIKNPELLWPTVLSCGYGHNVCRVPFHRLLLYLTDPIRTCVTGIHNSFPFIVLLLYIRQR